VIEPMPIVLPRMNWAHCTILLSRAFVLEQQVRTIVRREHIEPCLLAPFSSASHSILCGRYLRGGALSFPPFFTCTVSSRHILSFPPYLDISFFVLAPFSLLFWLLASFGKIAQVRSFSWNQYQPTQCV
jgi:hypothetical protein